MSEPAAKRIALTTLSAPAKREKEKENKEKDKKEQGGRQPQSKTHRFVLNLPDSTEESCPEFNFAELLSSVVTSQQPKKKDPPHVNGSGPPPLDPFADDDEDQLRNIAKRFEEKYGGPVGKKKKSKKYDEYIDLGAGYDETDPFIDNTDAYDEIVPAELTTAHGGFYINSGALEFKPVEEGDEGGSDSGDSDESESSSNESDSEDSESEPSAPRKRRVIESDDEDSKEELGTRNGKEPTAPTVNGTEDADKKQKKRIRLEDVVLKNPPKPPPPAPHESPAPTSTPASASVPPAVTFAASHLVPASVSTTLSSTSMTPVVTISKKVRPTVKELLQQKREKEKDTETKEAPPPSTAKSGSDSGSDSSDSSSDSSDSDSESESDDDDGDEGKESGKGESVEEVRTLPNNLPPTLITAVEDIKKAAAASSEQGKCRFFSSEVNRLLLSIELLSRQLLCSKRQAVFSYLATFLPCTKHTLLKRAKNLVLESVEAQLKGAMKKLQVAIEKVIPEQIERHTNECLQLAEAKDPELEPAGATDGEEEKSDKSKNPPLRRRFQWNKDIRLLLNQVVYLKAECFHWSKMRKESAEEYLTRFLDTEVKCLWPKGWMSTKILFKESKEAHTFVTSKMAPKSTPGASKKPGTSLLAGLIDTLAPSSAHSSTATSSTPATSVPVIMSSLASSTTVSSSNEAKKSHQPREKMSPASTPSRIETLIHSKADGTASKSRNEFGNRESNPINAASSSGGSATMKSELGHNRTDPVPIANRVEVNAGKHRTEPLGALGKSSDKSNATVSSSKVLDPMKSSQAMKSESSGNNNKHRLDGQQNNSNNRATGDANVSKTDHGSGEAGRSRNESTKLTSGTIHVRPDLCTVRPETNVKRPDRPEVNVKRSDTITKDVKGRIDNVHSSHRTDSTSDPTKPNRFDPVGHFSRVDSIQSQPTSKPADPAKSEGSTSPVKNETAGKVHRVKTPLSSSVASSLATLVDSGFQWKEELVQINDDDKGTRPAPSSGETPRSESSKSAEVSKSQQEEPEDQESLLQRDLAMVLEELTRQADARDEPKPDRTKSVIKSTGTISTIVSSAPQLPKMPSPTVSVLSKSTPVSRTSPLPATAPPMSPVSANKMTSPNCNQNPSRLVSPQSVNLPLSLSVSNVSNELSNPGSSFSKYGSVTINKVPSTEFMTPPTAHSSSSSSSTTNRHLPFFGTADMQQHSSSGGVSVNMVSPEKRKSETSGPLPAHQQHSSTTSISRNPIFSRSYSSPNSQSTSTTPAASNVTPTSSRAPSTYHSIESLMQQNRSDSFPPSAHRSTMVTQQQHLQQQQQQQHGLPKLDPFAMFLSQKNSTQRGSGHH